MAAKPRKSVLRTRWENRPRLTGVTRLSVSGSRSLKDERVRILILEALDKYQATHLVTHGEPGGVCQVARDLARAKAIPLTLHFLDFSHRRGAFHHRTLAVFYATDVALFIHDGKSKGTANEYDVARKMGIPCEFHELDPAPYDVSVGFPLENGEWLAALELEELEIPDLDPGTPKS